MIDLYSDTMTKPTPAMRQCMAIAEVGDEQKGEDPTVNRLQEMVAELLGKEAAVYLPSGTMCNEISFAVWARTGDEMILHRDSHPVHFEVGGPAFLARMMLYPLDGPRGLFTAAQVEEAIRPDSPHYPRSRIVEIENTHNMGGGSIWPLAQLQAVCATAHRYGLVTHMDGARLLNAVVATGIPARTYAEPFDSVWIDLSKGLGCPVGAVLAGSRDFIKDARRLKHLFGGAMRQAGIIAAAGVYALQHHVTRLAEDHAHAQMLAQALAELSTVDLNPVDVETNIVIFGVAAAGRPAVEIAEQLEKEGVRVSVVSRTKLRAVTHLDVSRQDIERAIAVFRRVL
ncbi:MAG TPA: GntG family PLP-dependent aldolase [Alphaproteobacteria bacterium]|nr:GntG family PLP-dependent aldolase [Alphaproteobacteria bacterium]